MDRLDYPENIGLVFFRDVELNFFQNGITEAFKGIFSQFSSENLAVEGVKLSGCEVTISGSNYTTTSGYIYLKGEVLKVEAGTVDGANKDVYFDVEETNYDALYPAPIDEGTSHQTRKKRIGKLIASASAPTDRMPTNAPTLVKKMRDDHYKPGIPFWFDPTLVGKEMSDYFNLTNGEGIAGTEFHGYALLGVYPGTERYAGKVLVNYKESDTNFGSFNNVGGSKTHILTIAEMPSHGHTFANSNTKDTGSGIQGGSGAGSVEETRTTSGSGLGQAHNNLQPYIVAGFIAKIS